MLNNKNAKTLETVTHTHTHTQANLTNRVSSRILKIIIFIAIFILLWKCVFSTFWIDKNSISYFFEEPENSLDVVYVGASNAYVHFNPMLAYDLYGFTTGILSTGSEPFAVMKYLISETEKYQKPNVYVIDICKIADDFSVARTEDIRRTTDAMHFSINRFEAINELLGYINLDKKEYINYYFSFLLYHNRWKTFKYSNIDNTELYKGYLFSEYTSEVNAEEKYNWTSDIAKLPEENEKALMNLINYIKENNLNVVFVVPVKTFTKTNNELLNDAISIIEENNLKIINFNLIDDLNIDFSKDLTDGSHLNVYGATKYTLYFAKYLKENYNLPNNKNNKLYSSWESEYNRFKKSFEELTNKNFEDLLLEYGVGEEN